MDPEDVPSGRAYRVEVAGVGGPRGGARRGAILATAALVVVVTGALLSSSLFPVPRGDVRPSDAAIRASASAASASADGGPVIAVPADVPLTPRTPAEPVDVAALIAAIPAHGTGPLAFVAGRLHSSRRPCAAGDPPSGCLSLRIDGLRGAPVVPDDALAAWPGDPAPGETLVLLPRDGKLVYLGSLLVDGAGIPRIDVLEARLRSDPIPTASPAPSLLEADGLLVAPVDPCSNGVGCPSATSLLFASTSLEGSDLVDGFAVRLARTALSATSGGWSVGPFLLRWMPSAAVPWQVVAREDPASVLHVIIP